MSDKSAQDLFNEMDILWDNFKKAMWQMSVVSDTMSETTKKEGSK